MIYRNRICPKYGLKMKYLDRVGIYVCMDCGYEEEWTMESNAFDSLINTIVFDPRDWSLNPKDLWIYGIIVGWEDECLKEFEQRFWWDGWIASPT